MNTKKADMGMGTLIIFIAMILVAAVAASVLIATTSKLQNKALDTGKLTTAEVGTGFQAIEVYAENGSDQSVQYFYETVKLAAGSDPVRFRDVLVTLSLSNEAADYTYNVGIDCTNESSINSTASGRGLYGVEYQISGSSWKDGYLNKGDVVKVCLNASRQVNESEEIKLSLVPKVGSILVVETTTPDLMVDTRVSIFP